jgi:conjugation system TraG family ATPase
LPDYTVIHKQDWFTEERYKAKPGEDASFLSRSFERHFNERPYLRHSCYLFITKTTKERMRSQSDFSTLCRSRIVPQEVGDPQAVERFAEAVSQAESILRESGLLRLRRLGAGEIIGTPGSPGLIAQYFTLSREPVTNEDIRFDPGRMMIGDKILCLHTLTDLDDLPQTVSTDARYERLSTDRSDCRLSFAAPVGLLLGCNHLYNQYIFLDNHEQTLRGFERLARNMNSLSRYSRSNAVNKEWIDLYLSQAHVDNMLSVRCHCNVISWAENSEELARIRNDVGAQLALMGCTPHHNTVDVPVLFWGGIPGNEGDFPAEESFYTFLEPALCFFTAETAYRSSPSPFGIKMVDRLTGVPVHLDISDEPMKRGVITNRNKFILGPSGSGKSFFTNHMVRQYYEQGAHIVLVDTGNSYKGLCDLIHKKSGGRDGIYLTYTEEEPICFNPFYTSDGVFDIEKRESIKTLILTLWKRDDEAPTRAEEVALSNAVNLYLAELKKNPALTPSFDTFYEFVGGDYRRLLRQKNVREKDFDIDGFLNVLEPYYRGGEYDYLLNSDKELDLLDKRFIVFELDNIRDHKILLPVVTIIIMETFISKMRRLKGVRKVILIEECWKALTSANMSEYIRYLFKTVRKYFGEAIVVTQEVDDIISSPIVKTTIIDNADCKILLDQRKYMNKFDQIQAMLGLSEKEKAQILSINLANDPARLYKEVWIGLGGVQSAVYATEVSAEEYLTFTTEEREKMEVFALAEKLGGDLEAAIRQLAEQRREG